MNTMKKVVFTGGGSGGHIMPLIAIIRELKSRPESQSMRLHYIGPYDAIARTLFLHENVKIHHIVSGKIRNYFSFFNIIDIFLKIPFSFFQGLFILAKLRPQLVFSKGGTGSVPVSWAARMLSIPVFIHESDAVAGKSNAEVSKFAQKTFTSFPQTEGIRSSRIIVAGNPIRKSLLQGYIIQPFAKPLILVWGGSQGAKAINDFIISILDELLSNYEVAHVVGEKNYKAIIGALKNKFSAGYHLYESLNEIELKNLLASADFVVSRAGAGSIFEMAAFGKPGIIIPLSAEISLHQLKNAIQYGSTGAAQVIEQQNLNRKSFISALEYCRANKDAMRQAALAFAKPDAAHKIAKHIIDYVFQEKE